MLFFQDHLCCFFSLEKGSLNLTNKDVRKTENENALHVFKTFYQSGLHPRNNNGERLEWPNKGYCVFKIKTPESQYRVQTQKNNRNGHAERNALNVIERNSHYNKNELITLYLTYSPCSKCAKLLQNFNTQNSFGIKLRIFLTRLHKNAKIRMPKYW